MSTSIHQLAVFFSMAICYQIHEPNLVIEGPQARLNEKTLESLESTFKELFPEHTKATLDITLVAWCGKISSTHEIPNLFDEVIVHIAVNGESHRDFLLSLMRLRGSDHLADWVHNMRWRANDGTGPIHWRDEFSAAPETGQILAFIKQTNFGKNEFMPDDRPFAIHLYGIRDPTIVETLEAGLPQVEKSRRLDLFMRMNASPADK